MTILERVRELQSSPRKLSYWDAMCQVSNETGCAIRDINFARTNEKKNLRAAKVLHDKQEFIKKHGVHIPRKPDRQLSLFSPQQPN